MATKALSSQKSDITALWAYKIGSPIRVNSVFEQNATGHLIITMLLVPRPHLSMRTCQISQWLLGVALLQLALRKDCAIVHTGSQFNSSDQVKKIHLLIYNDCGII